MTYFKMFALAAAAVFTFQAAAQEPTSKLGKYRGWGDNNVSFNSQAQLVGDPSACSRFSQARCPFPSV